MTVVAVRGPRCLVLIRDQWFAVRGDSFLPHVKQVGGGVWLPI